MTDTRGRARIGVLVPFTNSNLEPDFAMMRPAGVSIHVARMGPTGANWSQRGQLGPIGPHQPKSRYTSTPQQK